MKTRKGGCVILTEIIKIENLTKVYDNTKVVDNLTLSVKKGEIFGFLGPNGAGKSTSINMMVGLLTPTSGTVKIETKEDETKASIGICPQEIILWQHLTCYENLMMMGKMYEVEKNILKERIPEILRKLQLTDKKDEQINNLSGGMKRRMNIAMATIHNPEILLLDEPSEGLDPQSRRLLWKYIKDEKESGKTIILTTHLLDEADMLSDTIAIIDHGQLLKMDTPENLKKSIGEGDILEIELQDMTKELVTQLEQLDDITNIKVEDNHLTIRLLDAITKLPDIIHIIEDEKLNLNDISIRQNTLEDVFIELTGRALRE